jgi:hypothetical protein
MLETYDGPENGNYINYINYINYAHYGSYCYCISGWLESIDSRVLYELDYKKPILNVVPIECILG